MTDTEIAWIAMAVVAYVVHAVSRAFEVRKIRGLLQADPSQEMKAALYRQTTWDGEPLGSVFGEALRVRG